MKTDKENRTIKELTKLKSERTDKEFIITVRQLLHNVGKKMLYIGLGIGVIAGFILGQFFEISIK